MSDLINAEHTRAVGALVIAASQIETRITALLAGFMETDIVTALTAVHHQQLTNRIDTLLALMHRAFGDDAKYDAITEPVKQAKNISDFRNTVVHCHWSPQPHGPPIAVRVTASGVLKRSRRAVDPHEIQTRADEAFEIVAMLDRLANAFPAKPSTLDPQED
jgi:hypothetical protein